MIHTIVVPGGRDQMMAFGRFIIISCLVTNLENGMRPMDRVVYSENADGSRGKPYSPQVFPQGIWRVGKPILVDPAKDPREYMQPWFIPTDACQLVDVWEVEQTDHLRYVAKTGEQVMDFGYGGHFSKCDFTLGCLKVTVEDDLLWLVSEIRQVQGAGDSVRLAVAANIQEEEA